jgi:hypothetical protein
LQNSELFWFPDAAYSDFDFAPDSATVAVTEAGNEIIELSARMLAGYRERSSDFVAQKLKTMQKVILGREGRVYESGQESNCPAGVAFWRVRFLGGLGWVIGGFWKICGAGSDLEVVLSRGLHSRWELWICIRDDRGEALDVSWKNAKAVSRFAPVCKRRYEL